MQAKGSKFACSKNVDIGYGYWRAALPKNLTAKEKLSVAAEKWREVQGTAEEKRFKEIAEGATMCDPAALGSEDGQAIRGKTTPEADWFGAFWLLKSIGFHNSMKFQN